MLDIIKYQLLSMIKLYSTYELQRDAEHWSKRCGRDIIIDFDEKRMFSSLIICHYFIILYHCHTILSILPFGAIKIILITNLSKTVAEGTFWVTYEVTMFVVLKMTFFGFDVYVMNGNQVRSN